LLLTAVNPAVGGVLVRGEKGTAKSTVVRALAALLPDRRSVRGCRFGCDPADPDPGCPDGPHPPEAESVHRASRLVELPVGATEAAGAVRGGRGGGRRAGRRGAGRGDPQAAGLRGRPGRVRRGLAGGGAGAGRPDRRGARAAALGGAAGRRAAPDRGGVRGLR